MRLEHAAAINARRAHYRLVIGRRAALRTKKLPPQRQPDDIRRAYYGDLQRLLIHPAVALVRAQLIPELPDIVAAAARGDARADAAKATKVNRVVASMARELAQRMNTDEMEQLAGKYARATSDRQRDQFGRQLKAAVGVEVPLQDRTLKPLIHHFTATNVALIQSIPQRMFSQVESTVLKGIGEGSRWEDIADDLQERFDVSDSTARLIARDQVGKFYAGLNEARQTELGITHFIWQTDEDERTCDICEPLNGNRYAWDDPPEAGLPGDAHPQCRCSADPDVEDLVRSLEED